MISACPGVYRITDTETGRFYIGSSVNIAKRWAQHKQRLSRGVHSNPRLQAIWNVDASRLSIELLEGTDGTRSAILGAEQRALDAARVGSNDLCMNVLSIAGSHLGRKRTESTRIALSAAQKGRRHRSESKEKMRAAKLGKPLTDEHKLSLSNAGRGKKLPPRGREPRPTMRLLCNDQVRAIRFAKAAGISYAGLRCLFGVSHGSLQKIIARQTYAEVV